MGCFMHVKDTFFFRCSRSSSWPSRSEDLLLVRGDAIIAKNQGTNTSRLKITSIHVRHLPMVCKIPLTKWNHFWSAVSSKILGLKRSNKTGLAELMNFCNLGYIVGSTLLSMFMKPNRQHWSSH